jgi:hypothetical protein
MKKIHAAQAGLVLLASMAVNALAQCAVDWQAVEKIKPQTRIRLEARERIRCYFESATDENLTCFRDRAGMWKPETRALSRVVIPRGEVRSVQLDREDDSQGFRSLILAAGGGGGWDSSQSPTAYAGVKIGGPFALNLGYDRLQGHSGFTTEGTLVLPLFRVPPFRKFVLPGTPDKPEARFVRLYAEPGLGYRAGGGRFGGYSSAGMLFLLFPDDRQQPYVEVERRFPFTDPMQGDTRISFGFMISLCQHCDFN